MQSVPAVVMCCVFSEGREKMDSLQKAIAALHEADAEAARRSTGDRMHPAARLVVCGGFLAATMSFGKYDLSGVLGMSLYLIVTAVWEDISLRKGFWRLKYLLLPLLLLCAANLLYDRYVVFCIGSLPVTGGMLSAAVLLAKGTFTMYAAYFLILSMGIDRLCMTFRRMGAPEGMVTVLLLTYRYLIVLLKETQRMVQAYALRSAGKKGVHMSAWGSFAGMLLLRSMDRAGDVYDSMLLRGYNGAFPCEEGQKRAGKGRNILYAAVWLGVFLILRSVPVFHLVGGLLCGQI